MPQIYPATTSQHMTAMRTLDQNGVGNLNDRKPSKLEQMRAEYQKKLMREKEEKMVHLYEENQRKAMMKFTRNGSGGTGDPGQINGARSPNGGKSVREFFNERRRMEATGAPMPNIDHHYRQAKGYNSPGGWSNRTGSGKSATNGSHLNKNSAGRDRAQPLAPIQRRPNLPAETAPTNGHARSGIPLRQQNPAVVAAEENPFQSRPRLLKHKPLPPTTNCHAGGDAMEGRPPPQASSLPRYVSQANKRQPQQQQQQQQQQQHQQQQQQHQDARQPQPPAGARTGMARTMNGRGKTNGHMGKDGAAGGGGKGHTKLTDFQKWHLEQNKARDERLKKFNANKPAVAANGGYWGQPDDDDDDHGDDENNNDDGDADDDEKENGRYGNRSHKNRLNRVNGQRHALKQEEEEEEEEEDGEEEEGDRHDDGEDDDDDDDEGEDLVKAQERALLEQIAAKQREVEVLRKERERDEEEERREAAMRKKREAAERARQKKLEEERRKEEEQQRKQEEEEERQERKREEQRQREDEKRRKEDEKRRREDDKRRQEEDRKAAKRQAEEERRQAKQQQQQKRQQQQQQQQYDDYDDSPPPVSSRSRQPKQSQRSPPTSSRAQDIDEKPLAAGGADAKFYMQAAASSDAKGSSGSLVQCRECGRKFAQDRIKKHQDACKKANKPRKEFDASKKRVEGTEMAKYTGKDRRPEPPKKKSNWRAQHEQFIESLRYAKKVTAYEKEGGDLRDLAPPPPSNNPDFVPCPHCGRTFNETAAERHIPRCQSLKTRPPPKNTRRR